MARLQRKHKLFIAVGILLNLVLCLGLYVNNRLDNMVAGLYGPGMVNTNLPPSSPSPSGGSENDPAAGAPEGSGVSSGTTGTSGSDGYRYVPGTVTPPEAPSTSDLTSGVEQRLGQPVDKKDLLKAGMIVMRKLTWDEINFLYNAGKKPKQSPEELRQAREILKGKLTAEEIKTLQELGKKYGQSLKFLN